MQCYSPLSIKRPDGYGSGDRITVPCGKCFACQAKKRSEWSLRLKHELKYYDKAIFLTLTYEDEKVPITCIEDNYRLSVNKEDVQLFLKRLRKKLGKRNIKYYLSSEYGGIFKRPHYHAIIFNLNNLDEKIITDAWGKGNIKIGSVTDASIHYVTGYIIVKDTNPQYTEKCFSLMSKGLGKKHIEENRKYYSGDTNKVYCQVNGYKVNMPRYYKEKLFSKETLEHNTEIVRNQLKSLTTDQIKDFIDKQKKFKKNRI